jgi:hypothetical protein
LNIPADGNITFWYRVSSETSSGGGDFLWFSIDGEIQGSGWSGEIDWAQASFPVKAGDHTFRWEYAKDGSVDTGSDTAWIDDIIFPGAAIRPYIISTPVAKFSGSITCDSPVTYGNDSVCTITIAPGYYLASFTDNTVDKMSSLLGNSYTISNVISDHIITGTFISNSDVEDFETGDLTKFPWSSGGNSTWSVTSGSGHTGSYAAEAPETLGDNQFSYLKTTLNIPVDSTISFWYRVSSEFQCDYLHFYINDVEQGTGWSGEVGWAQATFPVTAGSRTFRWEFAKDASDTASTGSNTAWIDDIMFTGATPPVKLVSGTNILYKGKLQDAYKAAVSGDSIMLKVGAPAGGLIADKDIVVTIKGGYDDTFASNSGVTSVGVINLRAGTVRVENVNIPAP